MVPSFRFTIEAVLSDNLGRAMRPGGPSGSMNGEICHEIGREADAWAYLHRFCKKI
jgi:hypothetical protein